MPEFSYAELLPAGPDETEYRRPGHLSQLRSILEVPNDRYVALDLLKNACIAAGGVLPMCQDTGTAIVMGKRASARCLFFADLSGPLLTIGSHR